MKQKQDGTYSVDETHSDLQSLDYLEGHREAGYGGLNKSSHGDYRLNDRWSRPNTYDDYHNRHQKY